MRPETDLLERAETCQSVHEPRKLVKDGSLPIRAVLRAIRVSTTDQIVLHRSSTAELDNPPNASFAHGHSPTDGVSRHALPKLVFQPERFYANLRSATGFALGHCGRCVSCYDPNRSAPALKPNVISEGRK